MRYRLRTLLILMAIGPPLLAGAIWALYPKVHSHTSVGRAQAQVEMLTWGVHHYVLDIGTLPPNLDALNNPPINLTVPEKWQGPYLEKAGLSIDPWRNNYEYMVLDPRKRKFRVWSKGRDGRSGTPDDILADAPLPERY